MSALGSSAVVSAAEQMRGIVGAENVRAATAADAVDGVLPQFVVEPGSAAEIAEALRCANAACLAVAPRGGGTKLGWGNRPTRCDLVFSLARMNKVVEHAAADLTVAVEAGCTIGELQRVLASQGQRLAIEPLWPGCATVGGVLATNDTGDLRIRFGGLRDLIIGVTLALPDGTLARSGGKVVKNVAGYDLMKLATGSLGTLAIITEAVFRLHPVFPETRSLTVAWKDIRDANHFVLAVLGSKLAFTGLQIRARDQGAAVDVRFEGTAAGVTAQCADLVGLAGGYTVCDAKLDVWSAREALLQPGGTVAKFSVVPSQLTFVSDKVSTHAKGDWEMVAHGTGIGHLRLNASADSVTKLRSEIEPEGSLVVLQCTAEMKNHLDVWGPAGDALGLMRRVKHEFDPNGTLNPGRFVGGI